MDFWSFFVGNTVRIMNRNHTKIVLQKQISINKWLKISIVENKNSIHST